MTIAATAVTTMPTAARPPTRRPITGGNWPRGGHLVAEPGRGVEPRVGRSGGGEERCDAHQPVAGRAEHGFRGDRQSGAAGVDDLVDGERAEHTREQPRRTRRSRSRARGRWPSAADVAGSARSLAVKVITPKPRNAKKVSATLDTISRERRVPRERQQVESRLAKVATENTVRMPMTTTTTTVWTLATACEPTTLRRGHHEEDEHREQLDPVVVVGDRGAGVAAERHRDHRGDDRVDRQQQPRDDACEVALPPPSDDVLEQPAGRGVPRPELGEGVTLQAATAPAMRNEIQTAEPATSPAAPRSAKIPAPTIAPTPMNAAWRTERPRDPTADCAWPSAEPPVSTMLPRSRTLGVRRLARPTPSILTR